MSKTPPVNPVPLWATSDAVYADPGKPWDGTVRKVDPGGLAVSGWTPEDEPTAQESNFQQNAIGQWLTWLQDQWLCNWVVTDLTATLGAEVFDIVWDPQTGSMGVWIALASTNIARDITVPGDDGTTLATALSPTRGFSTQNVVGIVILEESDTVSTLVGAAITTNIETAGDILIHGVHDLDSGNDVIAGFLGGTDLGFIYGTTPGTVDLSRSGDTFPVPDLGGGAGVARGNVNHDNCVVATDDDGTILCLVSYHGSGSGRVDQFVSADGGVTWTETQDVIAGITPSTLTRLRDLRWDASRSLWVASITDGRIYTAPTAGSSSWSAAAALDAMWNLSSGLGCGRLLVVGGTWIVQNSTFSGSGSGSLAWSRDGGTTWANVQHPMRGRAFSYSPERGQLTIASNGVAGSLRFGWSLAMGGAHQ